MEIRAMSPQETAQWCGSLALCGIKGGLLRNLQDQIVRQQIDGSLFDKMLKSNTLTDLGIEDLNPRLSLAIRRSWTTDFGSVNFIDSRQSVPQAPPGQYRGDSPHLEQPQLQPPRLSMTPQQQQDPDSRWDQSRMRNHPSRESQPPNSQQSSIRARDHPSRESVPGHRPWATYEDDPPPRSRGVGGNSMGRSSVASSSMARGPPTPGLTGNSSGFQAPPGPPDHFGNAPRDLFGARAPQASFDMPPYSSPYGGARPSVNEDVSDPRSHVGEYMRPGHDHQAYPNQRPQSRGPQGVPPLSMGNTMGSTSGSMGGGMDVGRWDDVPSMSPLDQTYDYRNGHRDVSPDMRGAPREMRPSPMGVNGQASWNAGLQDPFVPRQGAPPNSYATDPAYDSIRPRGGNIPQSPMHAWEGGLGEMLPPRAQLPTNVAQPYAKAAREAQQAEEMARTAAKERAEAEARRAAEAEELARAHFQRSYSPQTSDFRQRQARASQAEADAEWGGMSLGDTLQPKRHAPNGVTSDPDSRGHSRNDYDRRNSGNASMQYNRRAQDHDRGGFDEFDERSAPRMSASNRPSHANGGFGGGGGSEFSGTGFEQNDEDFCVQVKVPKGENQRSPEPVSRAPIKLEAQEQRQWSPPKSRGRQSAAPPADDGWGGVSLSDAFAPKKPAPAQGDVGGSSGSRAFPPRKGEACSTAADGGSCNKSPDEIIAWVRTLPESHVPEKSRQNLAEIIEDRCMSGQEFTSYVKSVPPEVCAPKHAMKLKAAWNNVLAETACIEVARQNARNQPTQKAAMIVV